MPQRKDISVLHRRLDESSSKMDKLCKDIHVNRKIDLVILALGLASFAVTVWRYTNA